MPVVELTTESAPPAAGPASSAPRLPRWLKRQVPKGNANHFTARMLDDLDLETVCDHARCPNRMECYAAKTATFMVMGDVCTRPCDFCSVAKGKTRSLDADEPARLAEAAARLGLEHVVITSVTRDDLPDGGADHFVRCIEAVRATSGASVEVLTPDFAGSLAAVDRVIDAAPEVFNHNTETVPRLYPRVRGRKSDYRWTLALLARIKQRAPGMLAKTGIMLGLGETQEELLDVVADLVDIGCDMLTLGQYLQPSLAHLPVERYLRPEEFDTLGRLAEQIGIAQVASGPFVRSSYRARELVAGVEGRRQ
ncbi:MAG: lipoyl synthase [Planctomycetales bacterium]|nr:lipoyl synthase [Planctomycetales bacterium]